MGFGLAVRNLFEGVPVHAYARAEPSIETTSENERGKEIHELITNSEFLLEERDPRHLFTSQDDDDEYDSNPPSFPNNSCGQALIATILKIYEFFSSGSVPNITIQDIRDDLDSITYIGNSEQQGFFRWDRQMMLSSVEAALNVYAVASPITVVTFPQIPVTGYSEEEVVSPAFLTDAQVSSLLLESQQIFAKGGMLVLFSAKYGGHLSLVSNLYIDENNELRVFIIDSFGDLVGDVSLRQYAGEQVNGHPAIISAFGVCPTYT
ncbi:MAG: hypothetical protein M3Q81_03520 [bacterium]|nr:hypothetical protein [bacterium]